MTRDGYAPVMTMADWIAESKEALSLRYVIHTSDIVGNGLIDRYWQGVAPALEKMRGLRSMA